MGENTEYKILKDVFRDYNSSSLELLNSKVKSINLFKKTNTLEIILFTLKQLKIKDIYTFEKYLEVRFGIANIKIKIETNSEQESVDKSCEKAELDAVETIIEKEWNDIVEYMSYKHPMSKAILAAADEYKATK